MIDEEVVLKMAEELKFDAIYKEVFELYGVTWDK